jgi:hypothetical protein
MALRASRNDERSSGEAMGQPFFLSTAVCTTCKSPPGPPSPTRSDRPGGNNRSANQDQRRRIEVLLVQLSTKPDQAQSREASETS